MQQKKAVIPVSSDESDGEDQILAQVMAESRAMAQNATAAQSGAGSSSAGSVAGSQVFNFDTNFICRASTLTLQDAIMSLSAKVDRDNSFTFEVRRSCVLDDLMHAMKSKCFHPTKKIYTWFVGESGSDTGGLTREMWGLFSREVLRLCDGKDNFKIIRHDAAKLQVPVHSCGYWVLTNSADCITVQFVPD